MGNKSESIKFFQPIIQSPENKKHGEKGAFLGRLINVFNLSGKKEYKYVAPGEVYSLQRYKKPSAGKIAIRVVLLMTGIVPLLAIVLKAIYQRINTLKETTQLPRLGEVRSRSNSETDLAGLRPTSITTPATRKRAWSSSDISAEREPLEKPKHRDLKRIAVSDSPLSFDTVSGVRASEDHPLIPGYVSKEGSSDAVQVDTASSDDAGAPTPHLSASTSASSEAAAASTQAAPAAAVAAASTQTVPAGEIVYAQSIHLERDSHLQGHFNDLLLAAKCAIEANSFSEKPPAESYDTIRAKLGENASQILSLEGLKRVVEDSVNQLKNRIPGFNTEFYLKKVCLYIELYKSFWKSEGTTAFIPRNDCGHCCDLLIIEGKPYILTETSISKHPEDGREYVFGYSYQEQKFIAVAKHFMGPLVSFLTGPATEEEKRGVREKAQVFAETTRPNLITTQYYQDAKGKQYQAQLINFKGSR